MGAFTTFCCICDDDDAIENTNSEYDDYSVITDLPTTDGHYIYIMRNEFYKDDVIKIGRTNNMVRRVRELNN